MSKECLICESYVGLACFKYGYTIDSDIPEPCNPCRSQMSEEEQKKIDKILLNCQMDYKECDDGTFDISIIEKSTGKRMQDLIIIKK